ncbi:MAG TPA: LPXTG cell wall anchor domain-containing protein [Anaerolineae bacterium]|nr:LPXTG cell wall anchor domain-containing protein [Anaerolineae bacterium]
MRGRWALGIVTVFAVLLGFSSLGLRYLPRSRADQGPLPPTFTPTFTPSGPTATPVPSDTPTSVFPTDTPSATGVSPTATQPPGGPPARTPRPQGEPPRPSKGVAVNACARVTRSEGLNLGEGPGFSFGHVQIVGVNDIVFVTDGPQRGDGLWWWKVRMRTGVVGWGIDDHLVPSVGACFGLVAPTGTVVSVSPSPLPAGPVVASANTPTGQSQLPVTGSGDMALVVAGAFVTILLVVGLIRRRSQSTV